MYTTDSRTAGEEKRGQAQLPVRISEHAQDQWAERTPAAISLEDAWELSVDVEAPEADSTAARLYPPYNALLVVQHTTVATVLNNDGRLKAPNLVRCDACDDLIDPVDADTCPWCGESQDDMVCPGRVTITRGETR